MKTSFLNFIAIASVAAMNGFLVFFTTHNGDLSWAVFFLAGLVKQESLRIKPTEETV